MSWKKHFLVSVGNRVCCTRCIHLLASYSLKVLVTTFVDFAKPKICEDTTSRVHQLLFPTIHKNDTNDEVKTVTYVVYVPTRSSWSPKLTHRHLYAYSLQKLICCGHYRTDGRVEGVAQRRARLYRSVDNQTPETYKIKLQKPRIRRTVMWGESEYSGKPANFSPRSSQFRFTSGFT